MQSLDKINQLSGPHAMLGDVDIKVLWVQNRIDSYNININKKEAVMTGCFLACCCLCMERVM